MFINIKEISNNRKKCVTNSDKLFKKRKIHSLDEFSVRAGVMELKI